MNNSSDACSIYSSDSRCLNLFYSFTGIQLVMMVVGTILNLIIVTTFYTRPSTRKKITNILHFNQATADIFNVGIFGVIYVLSTLSELHNGHPSPDLMMLLFICLIISLLSSLLLYILISSERLLSIYFPLRHRVYLRKKHIWFTVGLVWFIAIIFTSCGIVLRVFETNALGVYLHFFSTVTLILTALITLLFVATFVKVLIANKFRKNESTQKAHTSNARQNLRITLVFFVMFMAFAVGFIPYSLALYLQIEGVVLPQIIITLILLASSSNAALTLYFRKPFLICPAAWRTTNIEMQQA